MYQDLEDQLLLSIQVTMTAYSYLIVALVFENRYLNNLDIYSCFSPTINFHLLMKQ